MAAQEERLSRPPVDNRAMSFVIAHHQRDRHAGIYADRFA
jgi:hypothetical protein